MGFQHRTWGNSWANTWLFSWGRAIEVVKRSAKRIYIFVNTLLNEFSVFKKPEELSRLRKPRG